MTTEWTTIASILDGEHTDKDVNIRGWIYRTRKGGKLVFIVLRDATGTIQVTVDKGAIEREQFNTAKKTLVESSVKIEGTVAEDSRAPGGYEVRVKSFEVVHSADVFPITKDQSEELLADLRHLWVRSRDMNATLKIRSTVFEAFREFYLGQDYTEVQSPMFVLGACEGGATLFDVGYKDESVKGGHKFYSHLSQSWQLYAEAIMFSLEKIFTIAPAFRAEKSRTRRHLTEFWLAEVEAAWVGNAEMMASAEEMVAHLVKRVLEKNRKELEYLKRDMTVLEDVKAPFERFKYAEILDMLKEKGVELEWGDDFGYNEEKTLTEDRRSPIFITHFPREKGFYHRPDPDEPNALLCHDLLAPEGYGEIIGGGERVWKPEELDERIRESGMEPEDYGWYVDLRKYGSVPHSGFGLGLDRTVAWICGAEHIKYVIPFPRTMRRVDP